MEKKMEMETVFMLGFIGISVPKIRENTYHFEACEKCHA